MEGQEKDRLLDKRKVNVYICISILISVSQIKKWDTMADRLWISSLPSSSSVSYVAL